MSETFHTYADDALGDDDATEVARRIRDREVSAVEVAGAAVARARSATPINAIVCEMYDRALDLARSFDNRDRDAPSGPFAAVPFFIKDQIDVKGLPTKLGSRAHANRAPAKANEPLTQQFFDMGFVGLGKSTMPEYGFTPSTEFVDDEPTHNPWNLARTPGGSSGGSGALVAAGVVPIAHAADGGGSIRIPASCNGLVGMKATRGRFPRTHFSDDQLLAITGHGIVSRSVRDLANYLAEVERMTPPKKRLALIGRVQRPTVQRLRIGFLLDGPGEVEISPEVRREMESVIGLLEGLGHDLVEQPVPVGADVVEAFKLYWALLAYLSNKTAKRGMDPNYDHDALTPFVKDLSRYTSKRLRSVPGAIRLLKQQKDQASKVVFSNIDVLLTPTIAQLPTVLGELSMLLDAETLFAKLANWCPFTPYANFAGTPSLTIPMGHDDATNLPVGVLLNGAWGDEATLLELALQMEAERPFRRIQDGPQGP